MGTVSAQEGEGFGGRPFEDYKSLDPSRAYELGGSLIHHSVYDTLVTFRPVSEILPNLAG